MKPRRRPQPADIDESMLGYEAATPHLTLLEAPALRAAARVDPTPKPPARRSVRGLLAAAFALRATPG